jgi:hypothetical protein
VPGLLLHRVPDADHCVLRAEGVLSLVTSPGLADGLEKALLDEGRVLLDVSLLRVTWLPAAQVLSTVLARTGGWPAAHLVLYGADHTLAGSLRSMRITQVAPLAPDLGAARAALARRPPRLVRTHALPGGERSLPEARRLVEWACEEWGVDADLTAAAVLVANELATNAVQHAGTPFAMTVSRDRLGLHLAVTDERPDRMPRLPDGPSGLGVVRAVSRAWGTTPQRHEKTVWATLAAA